MKILSIDLASKQTGWAMFEEDNLINFDIIKPKTTLKEVERLPIIYSEIIQLLSHYKPDLILLENPVGGDEDTKGPEKNWLTMSVLFKVHGVALLAAELKDIKYEYISPSTWQYILDIRARDRNSRKAGAKRYVLDKYKQVPENAEQDIYDAICLFDCYKKAQKEVLEWN